MKKHRTVKDGWYGRGEYWRAGVLVDIVGLFTDKTKAENVAISLERYFGTSDQNIEVFDLPEPDGKMVLSMPRS